MKCHGVIADAVSTQRNRLNGVKTHIAVRRFDPARDAPALRNCLIEQQNFHHGLQPSWPSGAAIIDDYLRYLDAECAAHDGCIFMADYAEQTAGFVCVVASTRNESPDDPAPFAWIHDIFVKPEYRRLGVASLLMAEAERFARSHGAHVLRLGVLDVNEHARDFYARQGFRAYTRVLTKTLA